MIKEIIDALSNDDKSLSTPFLKTQVFASRIGNEQLYTWVTKELNGFNANDFIPEYRLAKANAFGTLSQGYIYEENVPLPISLFSERTADFLIKFRVDRGIKALESMASGQHGDTVIKSLPADFCAMMTKEASAKGANVTISNARILVHINEFMNSLSRIRATLLDLLLKIETEFPDIDDIIRTNAHNKSDVSQAITHIMTQININSSGQGNIVNSGNHNSITANINITTGNVQSLRDELQRNEVPAEDIDEIAEIIVQEQPDGADFGHRVKGWLSKMINKSIEGTWEVGVATAGGLLVEALKKFYGF